MWDNVLGHTQVKSFLASYLHKQERPHALLFCGAEGLGKRKLAMEFARSLLCFRHGEKDGCESCRLMNLEAGNLGHPDFLYIHREEDPKTHRLRDLSIDQMRELVGKSAYAPVMSSTKVCIIEDVDRMGEPAANSFLKLLEEPPKGWVFILLATSADKLLTTILSRVVQLRFSSIEFSLVEQVLRDYKQPDEKGEVSLIPAEQIPVLARISEGSIGLAVQYYSLNALSYREQAYSFLEALPLQAPISYLTGRPWVDKYERTEALMFVQLLQLLLRDILVCSLHLDIELYNCDLQAELKELSNAWKPKNIKKCLVVVNETYLALNANVSVKVAMEAMAIKIDNLSKE